MNIKRAIMIGLVMAEAKKLPIEIVKMILDINKKAYERENYCAWCDITCHYYDKCGVCKKRIKMCCIEKSEMLEYLESQGATISRNMRGFEVVVCPFCGDQVCQNCKSYNTVYGGEIGGCCEESKVIIVAERILKKYGLDGGWEQE